MAKKKYKLTQKELINPGVGKLLANENEALKESLKITQNAHETLRNEYNETDKNCAILNEKMKIHIWIEVFKVLLSVGIGYFTNLITGAYSNLRLLFLVTFVLGYVVLLVVQYRNKK